MKTLLVTTLIAGALAGSVFAEANIAFQANRTDGLVYYSTDDVTKTAFPVGNPASYGTFGNLNIALYYAPAGTPSPFSPISAGTLGLAWTESENVAHQTTPFAGNVLPYAFTLSNVSGSVNTYQSVMVLGWTGNYGDWNSAFVANTANPGSILLGWSGSMLSGGALAWDNVANVMPSFPSDLTYGSQGFNGLALEVIPEPSVFALASLGAVALMNFRRRK
jgi:hypothetical protein